MTSLTLYLQACVRTWHQQSESARIRTERREIRSTLQKSFETLVDAKCRALKALGVAGTEHAHLEVAIVNLGYALEEYRDRA